MTYEYYCPICGKSYDIDKPVDLASREELCQTCNIILLRRYYAPRLNVHTLTIREKADLHTYQSETGRELQCIGEQRMTSNPKLEDYTLPREVLAKLEN